jgi:hypothetical protein
LSDGSFSEFADVWESSRWNSRGEALVELVEDEGLDSLISVDVLWVSVESEFLLDEGEFVGNQLDFNTSV